MDDSFQTPVGIDNEINATRRCEIETKAEIKYCAYHGDIIRVTLFAALNLTKKLNASSRVGLPEIDAFSEPVVCIFAWAKWIAIQQAVSNGFAAAMISEDEGST
jgi:hypothetical protein